MSVLNAKGSCQEVLSRGWPCCDSAVLKGGCYADHRLDGGGSRGSRKTCGEAPAGGNSREEQMMEDDGLG